MQCLRPLHSAKLDRLLAHSQLSQIADLLVNLFQLATQDFHVPRILRPIQLLPNAGAHQRQALQLASAFSFLLCEDVFLFGGCDCVGGFALLFFYGLAFPTSGHALIIG
jgi:hypothetical protein